MTLEWHKRPVRMARRDFLADFTSYARRDLAEMAREMVEDWHVNCEWIMATPGCAPGTGHLVTFNSDRFEKAPGLGDFDIIRSYLPRAKKRGIRLIAYINQHWYSYAYAKEHPEYAEQLLEDGTPYGARNPLYGNGTTFCVNSPWRQFAFAMIAEVVALGVDGCFLDGPVVFPKCCYCEHCREGFKKNYGFDYLPSFGDWSDKAWKPFLKFRRESWARFLKDARAASAAVNPDAVIFLNGGRFDANGVNTARSAAAMEKHQDFNGAEEFFHVSESYVSPFRSLNLGRFLSAGDKPGVVFTHHTLSAWHYIPLSIPEMTSAMAQTIAAGANTWFAIFMEAMNYRPEEAFAANDIQKFFADNEAYYAESASAAEVALLTSENTVYGYISQFRELTANVGSGKEQDLVTDIGDGARKESVNARRAASETILNKELHGAFDIANSAHVPVKVLWDEHLVPEKLSAVSVLVLPTAACLSDARIAAIMDFVRNGGSLAAFFESGFYDENGDAVQRGEWLEFLGAREVEGAFTPSANEDYATLYGDRLPGIDKAKLLIPRFYNALKIRSRDDAEILGRFLNPVGKAYQALTGESSYPAALLSKRGSGRVVYCPGALFESFTKFHLDDHARFFHSIVRLLSEDAAAQVETDAPGSLAVEIRKNADYLTLFLVNATGDMKRPIGKIVPLTDIHFSLRLAKKPRSVRSVATGEDLAFKYADKRLTFTLPAMAAYDMIAIVPGN